MQYSACDTIMCCTVYVHVTAVTASIENFDMLRLYMK